jgi:hypothetical protein
MKQNKLFVTLTMLSVWTVIANAEVSYGSCTFKLPNTKEGAIFAFGLNGGGKDASSSASWGEQICTKDGICTVGWRYDSNTKKAQGIPQEAFRPKDDSIVIDQNKLVTSLIAFATDYSWYHLNRTFFGTREDFWFKDSSEQFWYEKEDGKIHDDDRVPFMTIEFNLKQVLGGRWAAKLTRYNTAAGEYMVDNGMPAIPATKMTLTQQSYTSALTFEKDQICCETSSEQIYGTVQDPTKPASASNSLCGYWPLGKKLL